MPKAFTSSQKNQIRQNLFKKGREYFIKYGLKKTSVDDLVRAVGIAKGTFYAFFESKESLFLAIHEASEARLRIELVGKIEKIKGPDERLRAFLKSSFALLEEDPLMLSVFGGGAMDSFSGFIASGEYEKHYRDDIVFLKDLIIRWQRSGIVRPVDPEVAAHMIASVIFLYLQKETLGAEMYVRVMDMLIDSLIKFLSIKS